MAAVSGHPVLQHKLALMRNVDQPPREFRRLLREITYYVGYEATTNLTVEQIDVQTPLGAGKGGHLSDKIAIVPVMRAGLGMVDGMLELLPNAAVHHIGMYRMQGSDIPVQYYNRLPRDAVADVSFVLDPLIASGRTLCATVGTLKKWGCPKIVVVSCVATEQGLKNLFDEFPDTIVHVAATGDTLTPEGKVIPGLGDAGDRQFNGPDEDEHSAVIVSNGRKRSMSSQSEDEAIAAAEDGDADGDAKKRR